MCTALRLSSVPEYTLPCFGLSLCFLRHSCRVSLVAAELIGTVCRRSLRCVRRTSGLLICKPTRGYRLTYGERVAVLSACRLLEPSTLQAYFVFVSASSGIEKNPTSVLGTGSYLNTVLPQPFPKSGPVLQCLCFGHFWVV